MLAVRESAVLRSLPLVVLPFVAATAAHAASFDCARAEAPDEKAICATPALNDADVRMNTMFDMEAELVAMGARDTLRATQKTWLASRSACMADVECLGAAYARRLAELQKVFKDIVSHGLR
jgi:uncharacterized protein